MHVFVDARPLVDTARGGVQRVAECLMDALLTTAPTDERWTFLTTGMHARAHPLQAQFPAHPWRHLTVPNKFLSLATAAHLISLDRVHGIARADDAVMLVLNLGFVGTLQLPYVLLVHDISFLIEPGWYSTRARFWHKAVHAAALIKNAKKILAVSEKTRADLMNYLSIPREHIHVLPLGTTSSPAPDQPLPDALQGKRYLLSLSANHARKNSACIIEAWRALQKETHFQDVHLVLVGASDIRPEKNLLTFSHIDDASISTLMRHAAAFAYPSWYEGFGLPLHEAAAFGIPCIASDMGALPHTAPQGTLFAPPMKPHLWSTLIKLILDNPSSHRTNSQAKDWLDAATCAREALLHTKK